MVGATGLFAISTPRIRAWPRTSTGAARACSSPFTIFWTLRPRAAATGTRRSITRLNHSRSVPGEEINRQLFRGTEIRHVRGEMIRVGMLHRAVPAEADKSVSALPVCGWLGRRLFHRQFKIAYGTVPGIRRGQNIFHPAGVHVVVAGRCAPRISIPPQSPRPVFSPVRDPCTRLSVRCRCSPP